MRETLPSRPGARTKQPMLYSGFYRWVSLYPPLLGAGIRVSYRPPDFDARMDLTRLNRNAVGTHFGGSLYAMCDPFFMLILMRQLGNEYVVWDKAATIHFLRPGRGTVSAHFHIPPERVDEIRAGADRGEKVEPVFSVDVVGRDREVVARVEKLLYVRREQARGSP